MRVRLCVCNFNFDWERAARGGGEVGLTVGDGVEILSSVSMKVVGATNASLSSTTPRSSERALA